MRKCLSSLCGVCLCLRDTWDPFQLNPIGAEKEEKRRCFLLAQYLVAVIVGLAVLTSAVISKVYMFTSVRVDERLWKALWVTAQVLEVHFPFKM